MKCPFRYLHEGMPRRVRVALRGAEAQRRLRVEHDWSIGIEVDVIQAQELAVLMHVPKAGSLRLDRGDVGTADRTSP